MRESPLSFAQQRLWLLDQFDTDSAAYNLPAAFNISGPLDAGALERSLQTIVERHDILRASFEMRDGNPVQLVAAKVSISLPVIDLSGLKGQQQENEIRRLSTAEAQLPFDLSRGPLLRARLLRLEQCEHVLLLVMHHIITDGWSVGVLVHELAASYEAIQAGRPVALPALTMQYPDFARQQREYLQGEHLAAQLTYWRGQLDGIPAEIALPADRPRPAVQTFAGARKTLDVPKCTWEALIALSRAQRCTPFMALLAVFQAMLCRYTGQDDIVVGTPIANRQRLETENMIGCFVNTLVLRTDLSGAPSFSQLLQRVRKVTLDAYEHQETPFEKLVEELKPARDLSRTPIFQVLFSLQNVPTPAKTRSGPTLTPRDVYNGKSKFDLSLYLWATDDALAGTLEYNTDLFDASTIERMIGSFQTLLQGAVVNPQQPVQTLPVLSRREQQQLLRDWNRTDTDRRQDCLQQLLAAQVQKTPNAVALVFGDERLSYRELDIRARHLAQLLQRKRVGPDVLVGVCFERSIEMVIALLGVLYAGGAYVPLDPAHPRDRIAAVLSDARVPIVLTQEQLAARLPGTGAEVICLHREGLDTAAAAAPGGDERVQGTGPENLAYVIYTSGSTGSPKGVAVSHRSLVNFLISMRGEPGLTEGDALLAVTTISFDIAGLELFLPLITGAHVVLASREQASDARQLIQLMNTASATMMQATPATWRMLIEAGWQGRDQLVALCGGELLPRELANAVAARVASLWNMYGPTESTIWSSLEQVTQEDVVVPLGHPIANTRLYVLDELLQPVPIGVRGELHVGGDGLARGYLHRPGLTAEKFVPDPFDSGGGRRLYATGDLVRRRASGKIEFLGRADHQVKLRGFRIELGEIEAVLALHPAVDQAVVMVREDVPGDQRLVSYVVATHGSEDGSAAPEAIDLRAWLAEKLPDYMVPATFVKLASMPLTANGKVDRRALPAPDRSRRDLAEPRTPMETRMARIWQEVLGLEHVGIHDNFFDLGGYSLLSVRFCARCEKELHVSINPRELVYQTLAQLAASHTEANTFPREAAAARLPQLAHRSAQPFYFGAGDQRLFGCYHEPAAVKRRAQAVVVCQPIGDEYIRFHRCCRLLATRLSRLGFPVLRFDYFGCGDSLGAGEDGRVSQWLADISKAIDELKRRSGADRVCLIGLRMGGALAMQSAAARQDVDCLVLWDAVYSGLAYLEELTASHRSMLRRAHVKPQPHPPGEADTEILGFPLTRELHADLAGLDVLSTPQLPASDILLVESNENACQEPLRRHVESTGARVKHLHRPVPQFWTWQEDFGGIVVPRRIVESIVLWISEVSA